MLPEVAAYLDALRKLRGKIIKTLEGLDGQTLNWTPTNDKTNSLYVLATHGVGSEHGWIYEILGRGDKTRNRPLEFQARGDSIDELLRMYERVGLETEAILGERTADELETTRAHDSYGQVTERWIILHVIEHYAEHLGQMYLTRQLWEGRKETRD